MLRPLVLAALVSASVLGAQEPETTPIAEPPTAEPAAAYGAVTIDAGMSRADVVTRLGAPAAERRSGAFTYLFFANGCARSCGMDDLVILRDGRVTDAIFRGEGRHYSGRSSSPAGVTPVATLGPRASRVIGEPSVSDAPAPSLVAPPAPRPPAAEGADPFGPAEPSERGGDRAPGAAPAPSRPSLATAEPAAAAASPAAPAPRPAAAASRRAPADAFRIVPVVPDSGAGRAPSDTTARP